jgi:hypothetical protein
VATTGGLVITCAVAIARATFSLMTAASFHINLTTGIIGMTRQPAMEGRKHTIRANSISRE